MGYRRLMFSSLRFKLSLSLMLALLAILSTQLLIRQFVILPRFQAQEYAIDKQALEQLKASTDHNFEALGNVVYDNAVWEEMVDRMAARDTDFLDDTYNDIDFYNVLNVNGIYFYQADRSLIWGMTLDESNTPMSNHDLSPIRPDLADAMLISRRDWIEQGYVPITRQGFTRLNGRPVMFVAVSNTLPNQTERFEGTVLFWRFLDDEWLAKLNEATRSALTLAFTEQKPAGTVEASEVLAPDAPVQRRGDMLTLLYRDTDNAPFMTLGLPAHERLYSNRLFDESLLAQILVAILALAGFYGYLNASTINPLDRLIQVIHWVSKTGNYGKRTGITVKNDIGRLAIQLEKMLELINSQRQELLSHNRRLQELSDTDQLTGLSNRRYLESLIYEMEDSPASSAMAVSLLVIDIDHFKLYNDHYGHAAGDRTIRQIAHLLNGLTHSATDHLARYGGEEFILVLHHTGPEDARAVAERLKESVRQLAIPHVDSPVAPVLTLSIGVATKPEGVPFRYSLLFNAADQALYQAKREGRNTVRSDVLATSASLA